MSYRFLASIFKIAAGAGALAVLIAAPLPGQTKSSAAKSKNWTVPRTPDGHPDLQGIWTNATLTPLQRPKQFDGKATVTDAEAKVFENAQVADAKKEDGASYGAIIDAAGSAGTGGYNVLFIDRGSELERVDGVKRTSLIVDPPDGKIPPMTPEARKRQAEMMRQYRRGESDNVKSHPVSERCLLGFGSTDGPPMLPVLYNNNYQIVQTPSTVMILVEMVHDARIIRMNSTHDPANIEKWLGDSIGHWEGDTLVVDTINFRPESRFRGASDKLHVIERFQRTGPNTILYRATIEDPNYTQPWTVEYPFLATKGPIYEYACHEGNYALTDILGGAEKAADQKAPTK